MLSWTRISAVLCAFLHPVCEWGLVLCTWQVVELVVVGDDEDGALGFSPPLVQHATCRVGRERVCNAPQSVIVVVAPLHNSLCEIWEG